MSEPFGREYASQYDLFYRDKDYAGECDLLARCFERHGREVKTILDLGCGTGNHALELARRGFSVVGLDRSAGMLAAAEAKARAAGLDGRAEFQQADVRGYDLDQRFDAVLMMFAVMGYVTENRDLLTALAAVRRHLVDGGLFVFDIWYGPAFLVEGPSDRVLELEEGDRRVIRIAKPHSDVGAHCCDVAYQLLELEGERLVRESHERHRMRYFFPQELDLLLSQSGLELLSLGSFPDIDRAPDAHTWNVLGVARAVDGAAAREGSHDGA